MHEQSLISRWLDFYQSLDSGARKPTTKAQRRFVKVCRGKLPPKTTHEIAYLRYKRIQTRIDKSVINKKDYKRDLECQRINLDKGRPKKSKKLIRQLDKEALMAERDRQINEEIRKKYTKRKIRK